MGRTQINAPDEVMTARFGEGTTARIKAALKPKESAAGFVRTAVEAELKRRERKPKPGPGE